MPILDPRPPEAAPSLPARAAIVLLQGYKRWVSPLLGAHCRFHPSCSDYAREAIARHGALRGGWLAMLRLGRCQPLCEGGLDPVPERFAWRPRRAAAQGPSHDHD